MSTIQTNAILDASGGNTTTVNGVTPNSDVVKGRNLIINGAMQVAQRTTSATGVNSNGYHSVDRFQILCRGGAEYTQSQSTDAPDGFGYSLKFECTTADASPSGTDRTFLQHLFEGQNVQAFGKGTTGHKSATASFWVKSSETGNMQVNLVDDSNNAQIHSFVTINSANTWEYKTLTYSMDHSGYEIDNDNARRFWIEWIISAGSDYTGGSAQTSWTIAPASNTRGAETTINSAASVGSTFLITGVKLEVGSVATEFDHRSYGEELALCHRYFQKYTYDNNQRVALGYADTTTRVRFPLHCPTFRTSPAVTGTNLDISSSAASITVNSSNETAQEIVITRASGTHTVGDVLQVHQAATEATLSFDAEL